MSAPPPSLLGSLAPLVVSGHLSYAGTLAVLGALDGPEADALAAAIVETAYRWRPWTRAAVAAWPCDPADLLLRGFPPRPPPPGLLACAVEWPIRAALRRDGARLCTLPASSPASSQVSWLRGHLSPYARQAAAWERFGLLDHGSAHAEIEAAAAGRARSEGWAPSVPEAAASAAWLDARAHAGVLEAAIRRAVWPLGASRAPGNLIIAAAQAANDAHGYVLPHDAVEAAAIRVAHRAARAEERRHGRA